jgi:hypothetical protein
MYSPVGGNNFPALHRISQFRSPQKRRALRLSLSIPVEFLLPN